VKSAIACLVVLAWSLNASAADRYITVASNVRVFVRDVGQGPPVVVVNGGPGLDFNYLAPDLAPLAERHRVIYFDQRGSGRSTIRNDVTAAQLVADLEAVRQGLGLSRMTLLGHSWGAGLAALYTAAHPTRVERLVLVDAIPPRVATLRAFETQLATRLSADQREALQEAAEARAAATNVPDIIRACRTYWTILLPAYYADETAIRRSRGAYCDGPAEAQLNEARVRDSVLASLGQYDWRPELARIQAPALVIHGANDPVPFQSAQEWAGTLPRARMLVLQHAGHMSYVEEPAQFFQAVETFLTGRWPAEAGRVTAPAIRRGR
jgi:proline iminopeptidase